MAIAQAAQLAVRGAVRYAPAIVDAAKRELSKVTNGKVNDITDLISYVGGNASRMKVATEALVRSGVKVDDILPVDVVGNDAQLQRIRASALTLVGSLQTRFAQGSDTTLAGPVDQIAKDALRKERVQTVLRVYGSQKAYFLCHPNGGVPPEDFVWYERVIARR